MVFAALAAAQAPQHSLHRAHGVGGRARLQPCPAPLPAMPGCPACMSMASRYGRVSRSRNTSPNDTRSSGRQTQRRVRGHAASRRKCTPASPTCARRCPFNLNKSTSVKPLDVFFEQKDCFSCDWIAHFSGRAPYTGSKPALSISASQKKPERAAPVFS